MLVLPLREAPGRVAVQRPNAVMVPIAMSIDVVVYVNVQFVVVSRSAGTPGQFNPDIGVGLPLVNVSELIGVLPVYNCTLKVSTWPTRAKVAGLEPVMVTVVAFWAAAVAANSPVTSNSAVQASPRSRARGATEDNDRDEPSPTQTRRGLALCCHM